jgi:thiol-disulfide isomerase/thioredoxin
MKEIRRMIEMKGKYLFIYPVFFMVLSLFFPYVTEALSVGQEAPSFTLHLFEGKTLSLSELKGKPVILNFWASW